MKLNNNHKHEVPQEVLDKIMESMVIVVCGPMNSGKSVLTSELCELYPDKNMYVNLAYESTREVDEILYEERGALVLPNDKYFGVVAPTLEDDSIFVIEDATSLSRSQLSTMGRYIYNLRKRKWIFIYVYHTLLKLSRAVLEDIGTFLVLKGKHKSLNHTKIGHYVLDKRMVIPIEQIAQNMNDFDTLYLWPDGTYYLNNIRGKVEPYTRQKTIFTEEDEKIWSLFLDTTLSYKGIANKMDCSPSHAWQICHSKIQQREDDDFLEELPRNLDTGGIPSEYAERQHGYIYYLKGKSTLDGSLLKDDDKRERVSKISKLEDIGNRATSTICDLIWDVLNEEDYGYDSIGVVHNLLKGPDIFLILNGTKKISIEVKNYNKTNKRKWLYPSEIQSKIVPKFEKYPDDRHLFVLGAGPSYKSKRILSKNNIQYKRISTNQLPLKISRGRRHSLKNTIRMWLDANL